MITKRLFALFTSIILILVSMSVLIFNSPELLASTTEPTIDIEYMPANYLPVQQPEAFYVDTQLMYISDNVVDAYLRDKLDELGPSEHVGIIVQFKDSVQTEDRIKLQQLEFEIIREYSVIPGIHCIGSKLAIESLAEYDRVFWLEYNEQLEYLMQGTTKVINATKVWRSDVYGMNGENLGRIDGTGITAVVLDSGIDAGHPDMDYGTKTIMNLKSDNGNPPWIEMENSDTSSGHGTHCAGTVAGNGDASGGAKSGVAVGANLIGLSVGELLFITGALGGLNWVYDHSKPNSNPYNIRVVSNSWGAGGGEYDPQDSISQAAEKITYENNVVVVFAAGNSGGDGSDIQASNYGNTPAIINVAALEHDGDGVAEFSSRGQADLNGTWPDIGAPGVRISSTAARRTLISTMNKNSYKTDFNPYYLAISGTSMATPHIAGICALIWQANPGLKTSNVHDDYNGDEFPDWFNLSNTLVHEVELILEASAHYIEPNGENGVPDNTSRGWTNKPYDFAQGYGMVMVDRAVAIALTLKELRTRDFDRDGSYDYPHATVFDALQSYKNIMMKDNVSKPTDSIETSWKGEWVKFNNQTSNVAPYYTDESHFLYIPPEAKILKLSLLYTAVRTDRPQVGTLNLVIDADGDGNIDWSQPVDAQANKVSEIDLESSGLSSHKGNVWVFNINGHGFIMPFINFLRENQYYEARIQYTVSAVMILDLDNTGDTEIGYHNLYAAHGQWEFAEPSYDYANGSISMPRFYYDLANVQPFQEPEKGKKKKEAAIWPWLLLALIIIALIIIIYVRYRKVRDQKVPYAEVKFEEN